MEEGFGEDAFESRIVAMGGHDDTARRLSRAEESML